MITQMIQFGIVCAPWLRDCSSRCQMTSYPVGRGEELWRRVHPDHYVENRISTGAFTNYEMSVDIARERKDMLFTLEAGPSVGIASFDSTVAYNCNQQVIGDPEEDNEAHALVIGAKPGSVRKALRDASTYFSRSQIEASS